jgi:GT2 family glycosyltransferase
MDLSIVTVNYNSTVLLQKLVDSVPAACPGLAYEMIIVDNHSRDTDEGTLRRNFNQCQVIINHTNRGFAYGCNQGMVKARGRNIALVNPDIILANGCLSLLSRYLDSHPDVGAVGPQLLNKDGSIQISCRRIPDLFSLFAESSGLSAAFSKTRFFGKYHMSNWAHNEERDVEQLMGACLMLRKSVVESLGLFDERYFMYFEEVDLCKRLLDHHYRIRYLPQAQAMHYKGESALTDKANALAAFYRSRSYYFRKHHGPLSGGLVKGISLLDAGLRFMYWSLRTLMKPRDTKARLFASGYYKAGRSILGGANHSQTAKKL